MATIPITGNPWKPISLVALVDDPLALIIGMLLDQQLPNTCLT